MSLEVSLAKLDGLRWTLEKWPDFRCTIYHTDMYVQGYGKTAIEAVNTAYFKFRREFKSMRGYFPGEFKPEAENEPS